MSEEDIRVLRNSVEWLSDLCRQLRAPLNIELTDCPMMESCNTLFVALSALWSEVNMTQGQRWYDTRSLPDFVTHQAYSVGLTQTADTHWRTTLTVNFYCADRQETMKYQDWSWSISEVFKREIRASAIDNIDATIVLQDWHYGHQSPLIECMTNQKGLSGSSPVKSYSSFPSSSFGK